ncbi:GYDIA family GHMP kinase [Gramella sp. KN1008]|uniref:GYDIA family GHMP kinase n=1 Tax=Gramella sp. KN1008 TaxID=2529298 RepID=UPI00103ECFBF|nr:GYDIA family GHMP kinase [Gramella sp. KN1008]TBW28055.1 GHMP kinase [Gramella sp. KN1008]
MQVFKSNGKVLLTGEYAVLDGAKALALPTKKGQSLEVAEDGKDIIKWTSLDENGETWFEAQFAIDNGKFQPKLDIEQQKDPEVRNTAQRLQQILSSAYEINPERFSGQIGYSITTRLDFNRKWGLGTSSTLINNIAQWLETDPYKLLEKSFGGSGYDIAAAGNDHPVTYQKTSHGPAVFTADFNPVFSDSLFFVYLNRKQNSRKAIAHYRNQSTENIRELTEKISGITEQVLQSENLEEFKLLLQAHEVLISKAINLPRIQTELFPDYHELIKSLGGWGGDFILAIGGEQEKEYFRRKGYNIIFDYSDLILS